MQISNNNPYAAVFQRIEQDASQANDAPKSEQRLQSDTVSISQESMHDKTDLGGGGYEPPHNR